MAVPVPDEETPSRHADSALEVTTPADIQPAAQQATPSHDSAPVELWSIAKLVLALGWILGVIGAVTTWCIATFLWWVPQMILGSALLFGAISLVKMATLLINIDWLGWVTVHGVRWNLASRFLVRLAAVVILPFGFYLFWGIMNPGANPWLNAVVEHNVSSSEVINIALSVGLQVAVGSVLLWASLLGWNAAKRSALFHQRRPLSVQDAAGEVVFFRSFAADAAPAAQEGVWSSFVFKSEEELLAEAMPRGTRFFAIGRPGEPLPEVGAERLYFCNEEWEAAALQLMSNAALVIVRPHQTPSLIWELRQIIATVPPQRVLIWVPPSMSADEWIAFQEAVKESFRPDLPAVDKLGNFIMFAPDWTSSAFSLASEAETMKSGKLYRPPPEGKKLVAAQLVALLKRAQNA